MTTLVEDDGASECSVFDGESTTTLDCGKLDLCDISGSVCSCTSQDCEVSTRSSIVDLSLIDDDQSLIGKIAEQDVLLHRQ